MKPFVNPIDLQIEPVTPKEIGVTALDEVDPSALLLSHLISHEEIQIFLDRLGDTEWQPVSITGMSGNYEPGDPIGSWRASSFQEAWAAALFDRIRRFLPEVKICDDSTATDWDGTRQWRAVGVNPLLRFIKYTDGGLLVPHYDAPYVADQNTRTLSSLVIYLNSNSDRATGGETRFLHDPQAQTPVADRVLYDEKDPATDDRVKRTVLPVSGQALLFDHRILHESHRMDGPGEKIIVRTDIVYERMA